VEKRLCVVRPHGGQPLEHGGEGGVDGGATDGL
jgi:hypothetical protein